jgi:hypothetical protein
MNQATKQVLEAIELIQAINQEADELTDLFNKRRGRNPDALQRIRDRVKSATCALTPMLVEALHQPEEVEE